MLHFFKKLFLKINREMPASTEVSEVSGVAKQITELEHRLKTLLKSSQPDEKSMRPVRLSLRDNYEKLILLDHKYATESQVEQSLWKLVFYKRIEDYRKRYSKMNSAVQVAEKKDRATEALKALNLSFSKFLEESKSFYLALLRKLLAICGIYIPEYSQEISSGSRSMIGDELIWSCHRCLIYLGDLDRYAQLYIEGGQSDWKTPEKHYDAASMLLPHVGNPHNQIAVLATYRADDLAGVYSYARALLCSSPFVTARENLSLLFEKNRLKCGDLHGRNLSKAARSADMHNKKRADFCSRFVRLQGVLWTKVDIDEYKMIETSILTELISLLDVGDLDGSPLIMMVITSIFIIHQIENDILDEIEDSVERVSTSNCFESALALAFKLFCKICVSARVRECQIAALCVFTDWLGHHMKYLVPADIDNQSSKKDVRVARQAFIENIVDFLNLTSTDRLQHVESEPLPEDLDLVGFLPLADAHQYLQRQIVKGALIELKQRSRDLESKNAKFLRIRKLENFAQKLASGPRPVLFYDSQNGEYSVEGSGVFNLATPAAADGVQSQQRGKVTGTRNTWSSVGARDAKSGSKDANQRSEHNDSNQRAAEPQATARASVLATVESGTPPSAAPDQTSSASSEPALVEDEMLGDSADHYDDETFGEAVSADGPVPDDFSAWAEQTAAFAAVHTAPQSILQAEGVDSRQPEEAEEVSDHYLELLVRKAIGTAVGDDLSTVAPPITSMETEDDEQEEIILFKPTRRANPDAGCNAGLERRVAVECAAGALRSSGPHDSRSSYLSPGMPPSGIGTSGPFLNTPLASSSPLLGNGCGVSPANALWGELGRGPSASFSGSASAASGTAVAGGRFEWACPEASADALHRLDEAAAARAQEVADRTRSASRFVTRNPFANAAGVQ
jgi:hypothetical protein